MNHIDGGKFGDFQLSCCDSHNESALFVCNSAMVNVTSAVSLCLAGFLFFTVSLFVINLIARAQLSY